ncbi:MAG: hypothetical protein ABIH78_03815 [Candidatus Peregrinibacteria bacterium]
MGGSSNEKNLGDKESVTGGKGGPGGETVVLPSFGCRDMLSDVDGLNPYDIYRIWDEVRIAVVRLGIGCDGGCITCGAFQGMSPEERRVWNISLDQLIDNLTKEIGVIQDGTRLRMIDLCRRFITTGVDADDPVNSDLFNQAARLVYLLSGGEKYYVAISHGVRAVQMGNGEWGVNPNQIRRIEETAQLMVEGVIPLFVLSMDLARDNGLAGCRSKTLRDRLHESKTENGPFMDLVEYNAWLGQQREGIAQESGEQWKKRLEGMKRTILDAVKRKMEEGLEPLTETERDVVLPCVVLERELLDSVVEANAKSFAATLNALTPAIKAGRRVTISLQGEPDSGLIVDSRNTMKVYARTMEILRSEYGMSEVDLQRSSSGLRYSDQIRRYVGVGRAKNVLGIADVVKCTTIPDSDFVFGVYLSDERDGKPFVGVLNPDGSLVACEQNIEASYNQLVDSSYPWKRVISTRVD